MNLFNWFKRNKHFFDLVDLDHKYLPILAGGAALHLYLNGRLESCRDIDIFFKSPSQISNFVMTLQKRFRLVNYQNSDADGFWPVKTEDPGWPEGEYLYSKTFQVEWQKRILNLNLIVTTLGNDINSFDVINSFDFTVCQVATTDGKNFIFGDKTQFDIENKILSFVDLDERIEYLDNYSVFTKEQKIDRILSRIQKYQGKGFISDEGILQFVLKYG